MLQRPLPADAEGPKTNGETMKLDPLDRAGVLAGQGATVAASLTCADELDLADDIA
jgi:hypothetical protein